MHQNYGQNQVGNLYSQYYGFCHSNNSHKPQIDQHYHGNNGWNYQDYYTYNHGDQMFKNVSTSYDYFGQIANEPAYSNQYTNQLYFQSNNFISNTSYNGYSIQPMDSVSTLSSTVWTGQPGVETGPIVQVDGGDPNDENGMTVGLLEQVVELVALQPELNAKIDSAEFHMVTPEVPEMDKVPVVEMVDTHPGLERTAKQRSRMGRSSRKTRRPVSYTHLRAHET